MKVVWWPDARMKYEGFRGTIRKKYDDKIDALERGESVEDNTHMYLERELHCNDRIHIDDHRLVYRVVRNFRNEDYIYIVAVGHKPSAYANAAAITYASLLGFLKRLVSPKSTSSGALP